MRTLALLLLLAAPSRAQPVTVPQDHFAAARAADAPAVRTFGFSTCVAVFLYDVGAKVGGVAHISASADAREMVSRLFGEMLRLGATGPMTAQLFGGWDTSSVKEEAGFTSTSPQIVADVKEALSRRAIVITREETLTVPFRDDPRGIPPIRNVSMHLATGEVADYQP